MVEDQAAPCPQPPMDLDSFRRFYDCEPAATGLSDTVALHSAIRLPGWIAPIRCAAVGEFQYFSHPDAEAG